ncbi:MAG: trypsin-like peptidase domain-containing protein [Anaerolineales bacterium]|jgi:S1-C subfamily serine protease
MKKPGTLLVLFAILLASLACGIQLAPQPAATLTSSPATVPPAAQPQSSATSPQLPAQTLVSSITDLSTLYEKVNPGVVTIWSFEHQGAAELESLPTGQGSGFVIDREGHIVTNQHVIAGAIDIEIDFVDGTKVWADLIGTDPDSDLAVLKVDLPAEQLNPLPLGDSDLVRVGDFVVAIGNPFGLSGTMTVGVVSAIGRSLTSERAAPGINRVFSAGDLIQTDAAINPGNSGGPLLNLGGQVVGINRAIQTETFTVDGSAANSGVGFAVPVNLLRRVVPTIISQGQYDYPYLGISSLNDERWNLKTIDVLGFESNTYGAYITETVAGGPADQAGLRAGTRETSIPGLLAGGDLIVAIDGVTVRQFDDLLSYLFKQTEVGQEITLTVIRDNEEVQLTLTVGARP